MRTLDSIWNEYETTKTQDIEYKLCKRIEKLAAIVLKSLGVKRYHKYYDDYLQTAYVQFFTIIPNFDPKKGKLEGYFMVSYKHEIIKLLKLYTEEMKETLISGEPIDIETPANLVLAADLERKIEESLTEEERYLYHTYLKIGERDTKFIASKEDEEEIIIKWAIDSLQRKAEKIIDEGEYDD